jgi:ABC-2 type transport system permease protein
VTLLVHQLLFEQRIFWRSREAAIFIFIFPLLLYVLLSSVYGDEVELNDEILPAGDVLLAGLLGYAAANTAFGGLAILLVTRREMGLLKRIRSTPLPSATYLTAMLLSILVIFALQAIALLVLGKLFFDASPPENWLGFAGAIVLGAASFACLGLAAAALIRSAESVAAVVNVALLPMAFLSGSFGPTGDYPAVLQAVADVLPLKYFLDIVNGIYLDGDSLFADPGALGVLAAWAIVALAIAVRRFGWVPRERPS